MSLSDRASLPGPEVWGRDDDVTPWPAAAVNHSYLTEPHWDYIGFQALLQEQTNPSSLNIAYH